MYLILSNRHRHYSLQLHQLTLFSVLWSWSLTSPHEVSKATISSKTNRPLEITPREQQSYYAINRDTLIHSTKEIVFASKYEFRVSSDDLYTNSATATC